ncbi:MAG: hypothetical protein PHU75_09390 [Candidatus Nanopelagicales bacterium]|nr:hypothetical protein [Candidatus Nanopelagicales bacterium]
MIPTCENCGHPARVPESTRCQECDRHAPLREFEGLLLCERCIGDRLAEQGRED